MSLAVEADLSAYLRRDLSAEAATVQLLLDGASAAVVEACGWHIAGPVTESVTVDGSGTLIQALPTLHLTDVASLTEDGNPVPVAALDWSTNGLLQKRQRVPWTGRRRGIVATMTHGLDVVPPWVVTLVCAIAGRAYVGGLGVSQEASGGEHVVYANPRIEPGLGGTITILPQEKSMLARLAVPKAS